MNKYQLFTLLLYIPFMLIIWSWSFAIYIDYGTLSYAWFIMALTRKKYPTNNMTYTQLHQATLGKEFIRVWDLKVLNRTEFFFEATNEEVIDLLNGYEGDYRLRDKEGWKNGELIKKDRPEPITMC